MLFCSASSCYEKRQENYATRKYILGNFAYILGVTHVGRAHIGGPWRLWDLNGKPFGSTDLEGCNYLIYFGFCNCPDVCPQSLYKISKALNILRQMPENKYIKLKTVFVSVDPNRDKKANIEKFLSFFDKEIIPVTARSIQIF